MGDMSKIMPKLYRNKAGGIPFPGRSTYMALELGANQNLIIHVENELMGAEKMPIGIVEGCSVPQVFILKLLAHYNDGPFAFDKLISFYSFRDTAKAFEDTHNGRVMKALLVKY